MEVRNGLQDVAISIKWLWGSNATRGGALGERVELDVYEDSSR